jgi:alpha-L-fucosidase
MKRRLYLVSVVSAITVLHLGLPPPGRLSAQATAAPVDMRERAAELQELKFGMFICWSFSSFSGYEWTPGVDDINFFHPTGFDPDQWCRVAKEAGMNYILFLTKHHDGFCLWDTQTTERKVSNTIALKDRDVLAEMKAACDRHGLKLALYFSEGDWSWSGRKDIHTSVARPDIKEAQLRELLTNYGPIEFIWFDHAVGDGGISHADTAALVKSIQPGCFVGYNTGSQDGADIRLGERSKAGPIDEVIPGSIGVKDMEGYSGFLAAEFTYPILEGQQKQRLRGAQWFYSLPENDERAASAEKIYSDYREALKYGNIFSLNVGPDRAGRLREIDIRTMRRVGRYIRGEERPPSASYRIEGRARASGTWENLPDFAPDKLIDGDAGTRWGAAEGSRSAWIEIELSDPKTIDGIVVNEGAWDRIRNFKLSVHSAGKWQMVATGEKLGGNYQARFDPLEAERIRLEIISATEVPTIHEIKITAAAGS